MFAIDFSIPPEGIYLYFQRRGRDLNKLRAAFQMKESSEFFRIGHSLMGNAVSFGFPELETLGKKIEGVANLNSWATAQELINELES